MRTARLLAAARWKLIPAAGGLAFLVAACGSGGAPSDGTTTSAPVPGATSPAIQVPNAVLCADVAALRASLDKLRHIQVGKTTANEITNDLKQVRADLAALANDAAGQWPAQTSALNSALNRLQTAVRNLTAQPSANALTDVSNALRDLNTAARNLLNAVNTRCPSPSPSPGT